MPDKKTDVPQKKIGVLSIISLVIGVSVFVFSWFPYIGCFGGPVAIIGILLGVIAAANKKVRWKMPVAGIVLSAVSIFTACLVSHFSTQKENLDKQLQRTGDDVMSQLESFAREAMKVQGDYINNYMELYETEAKYKTDESGKRNVAVRFKIKNNGDRTLEVVHVAVSFKNEADAYVAQADFYPVRPQYAQEPTEPLKPNGIWQMEESEYITIPGEPNDWIEGNANWEEGNVEIKILVTL